MLNRASAFRICRSSPMILSGLTAHARCEDDRLGENDQVWNWSGCPPGGGSAFHHRRRRLCRRSCFASPMLWRGGSLAARACRDRTHRRECGQSRARRRLRSHRCRRDRRQGRRHTAVFHARVLGRTEGLFHHPPRAAGRSRAARRRLRRFRRRRDGSAGARRRRIGGGRLSAVARADRSRRGGEAASTENLARLPDRQYRRDDCVRRQGGDRCRLRQSRRTSPKSASSTTG